MRPILLTLLTVLLAGAGCAQRGNVDLLEAQLRSQEQALNAMQVQTEQSQRDLELARGEIQQLQAELSNRSGSPLVTEQRQVLVRTEKLSINRLLTGALNQDAEPGDEILSVNLLPVDADGDTIKLYGPVQIELLDLSLPHDQQQIGSWSFTESEAKAAWHRGLVSSGYLFRLPWQKRPANSRLTLHATLTSPDGRRFDTTEIIEVDPNRIAFTDREPGSITGDIPTPTPFGNVTPFQSGTSNPVTLPAPAPVDVESDPPVVVETVPPAEPEPFDVPLAPPSATPMPAPEPFGSSEPFDETEPLEEGERITVPAEENRPSISTPGRLVAPPAAAGPVIHNPPRLMGPTADSLPDENPFASTGMMKPPERLRGPNDNVMPAAGTQPDFDLSGITPTSGQTGDTLPELQIIPATNSSQPKVGDEIELGSYPPRGDGGGLRIIPQPGTGPGAIPARLPAPTPIRGPVENPFTAEEGLQIHPLP